MAHWRDVRFALRMLRKNPGFTAVAVLALALGIGANNTVFTIVNTILFKSLPFRDGHEIMALGCTQIARGQQRMAVSYLDFRDWGAQSRCFQGMGAFSTGTMNLSDEGGVPERQSGAWLTANTFEVLGVKPVMGRDFGPSEDQKGAQPVVLLGYAIWQNRYGGNPAILGKTVRINAISATVIGVMPQGMKFPFDAELWMPLLSTKPREARDYRDLLVFGRLGKNVSLAEARAELSSIVSRLAQEYPKTNAGIGAEVLSFNERYNGGRMTIVLWVLMGAVGFVLLIACANVANLLLARAAYRSPEIAIRAAVGAGRRHIVCQLLVESLLLAILGGVLGLLLSVMGVQWFHATLSAANIEGMPYWLDFSMDWKVFTYLLAICFATTMVFGLAPALKASRLNLVEALKQSGSGWDDSSRPSRLASALVVAQLSLTLVLLSGAGMMIQDFLKSQKTQVGISPQNVLTMRITLPEQKYPTPEDRVRFHEKLSQELAAVPGIQSVAITSNLPVDGAGTGILQLEGQSGAEKEKLPRILTVIVSPGYFETIGAGLVRGRMLREKDGLPGSEVALVNERFAAKYWPGRDPLGRRMRISPDTDAPWLTVVGVVPQVNQEIEKNASADSILYIPYRQSPVRSVSIAARTLVPPSALVPMFREKVKAVDPDLPLFRVRTLDEHLAQQLWPYRVFGSLFAAFAFISLLLSAVGIYGVTAYAVSRRTREIGLRMALGADGRNVLLLVLHQGLRQLLIGLALGLPGALMIGRVLETLLVETTATDPASNLGGSLILCLIMLIACVIPAWKASRLDPLTALRCHSS
jgi:putative ABC transport system permease protein